RRGPWAVCLTLLLALGVLAWWFSSPSQAPPGLHDAALVERAPEPVAAAVKPVAAPVAPPPPQKQTAPVDYSPDGVPIRPAGSDEVNAVGMQPHPITPEHQRIFRENNLIGDLNGAMDIKD